MRSRGADCSSASKAILVNSQIRKKTFIHGVYWDCCRRSISSFLVGFACAEVVVHKARANEITSLAAKCVMTRSPGGAKFFASRTCS